MNIYWTAALGRCTHDGDSRSNITNNTQANRTPAAIMDSTITHRPHRPRNLYIQMSGSPGSGKSTTAKLLAQSLDSAVILDHDVLRSSVLEDKAAFAEAATLAYALGWALAEDMIRQGKSVILDSPCNYDEVLQRGSALARRHGWEYWYVECRLDDADVLDARLRGRRCRRSQRTGVGCAPVDTDGTWLREDCKRLFRESVEGRCRPGDNVVIVDSTESPERGRDHVLQRIRPGAGLSYEGASYS